MSTENNKILFEPKIPEPTKADLRWAKRVETWGLIRAHVKLRDIVDNNQIWRLNFLLERYKDSLDLSYHYNRTSGSFCGESLFGRAVEREHEDIILLLSRWKAPMRHLDSIWEKVVERKSKSMAYAFLQYEEVDDTCLFYLSLECHAYKIAQVFIDMGKVSYDDALTVVASKGDMEVVTFLIKKGADISANDYATIKEAEDNGYFEIVNYLKEKAGLIEKEALALPAPVPELGSNLYEKVSDVELLKTSVSENGSMTLTTVFNFEMEDVVRTQYVAGQAPSETHRKFKDFDDKTCLKEMFDELRRRDGHPPSGMFKNVDKRVKIKKLNSA